MTTAAYSPRFDCPERARFADVEGTKCAYETDSFKALTAHLRVIHGYRMSEAVLTAKRQMERG